MILVDTSVWIDHFRGRDTALDTVLAAELEMVHPFVYGELLLSGLPRVSVHRAALQNAVQAPLASTAEVAAFIDWAGLTGTGLGYGDAHLLVSARLSNALLLTHDQRLATQAERLNLSFRS